MTSEFPNAVLHALRDARHVAVLTGAGVSAESGIPTFRDSLTGLWANFRAEELATPEAFERNPRMVWDWYAERRARVALAEPNAAHEALVRLESLVPRLTLVTQNVDGLHGRAGSRDVLELHGNISRVKCSREQLIVERWEEAGPLPPPCPRCGAPLRPDVVWFGESLPAREMQLAQDAARECDVFLSVGTSNLVEPAASLPWTAARRGATVVIVNPTMDGQRAGPTVHALTGRAGLVLPALLREAWPLEAKR